MSVSIRCLRDLNMYKQNEVMNGSSEEKKAGKNLKQRRGGDEIKFVLPNN